MIGSTTQNPPRRQRHLNNRSQTTTNGNYRCFHVTSACVRAFNLWCVWVLPSDDFISNTHIPYWLERQIAHPNRSFRYIAVVAEVERAHPTLVLDELLLVRVERTRQRVAVGVPKRAEVRDG